MTIRTAETGLISVFPQSENTLYTPHALNILKFGCLETSEFQSISIMDNMLDNV